MIIWTSRNNWSVIMREIQASEAKTHLPQLLDEIERGESIIITRHGRPIARLIPEDVMRRDGQAEAVERLKALRATMPRVPLDELMAMRHEGHRH